MEEDNIWGYAEMITVTLKCAMNHLDKDLAIGAKVDVPRDVALVWKKAGICT